VELGVENIAWLGGHWGHNKETRITSDKVTESGKAGFVGFTMCQRAEPVPSGQQEEFGRLIISDPNARDWLHRHLSAAFTAGAAGRRLVRPTQTVAVHRPHRVRSRNVRRHVRRRKRG